MSNYLLKAGPATINACAARVRHLPLKLENGRLLSCAHARGESHTTTRTYTILSSCLCAMSVCHCIIDMNMSSISLRNQLELELGLMPCQRVYISKIYRLSSICWCSHLSVPPWPGGPAHYQPRRLQDQHHSCVLKIRLFHSECIRIWTNLRLWSIDTISLRKGTQWNLLE